MSGDVQFEGTPEEWKALVEKSIQKKLLTEIMDADAKDGLYHIGDTNKMMTAVEWLMDNLPNRFKNAMLNECSEEIEQAKQMEKEQIINAYWNGTTDMEKEDAYLMAEDYFNEYYKK
jgi:ribosomal protein S7